MKEKFNYFMERLGSIWLMVLLVVFILAMLWPLVKRGWEAEMGRQEFYRDYHHSRYNK